MTEGWLKMASIYRRFSEKDWPQADFSSEAAERMFAHETYGKPIDTMNGFAIGKKWMDVTLKMWKEDIRAGLLCKYELYGNYPTWWLDKELAGVWGTHALLEP